MGFWLKVIGGLFAYNVAKKHIATKNDLKKSGKIWTRISRPHSLSQVRLIISTEMAGTVIGSPAPARS